MKYSEIKRKLTKAGCYLKREGGNHEVWYSPITNLSFTIGRHNAEEVKIKTLRSIAKQSGVEL